MFWTPQLVPDRMNREKMAESHKIRSQQRVSDTMVYYI